MSNEPEGPRLPNGMSASYMLDNISKKERTAHAQAAGMTLARYDAYLQKLAKAERLTATISSAQAQLRDEDASAERDPNEVQAERAVMHGICELRRRLTHTLSEKEEHAREKGAYSLIDQIRYNGDRKTVLDIRCQARRLFGESLLSQALKEIEALVAQGLSHADACTRVADNFERQSERQNVEERGDALRMVASRIRHDWCRHAELQDLIRLISQFESGVLGPEEADLLRRFVSYAKAVYFQSSRKSKFDSFGLERYQGFLDPIVSAYRERGPHKRVANKTSGAAELAAGHTVSVGLRKTPRPRRDPSGGSGERD